jgi:hypothetical protein
MKVSLFKTVIDQHDLSNPAIVDAISVLRGIKNGRWKALVNDVRMQHNKEGRDKVKKKMPAVVFAGEFSYRSIDSFNKGSGLVTIDFDGLSEQGIEDIEGRLKQLPFVFAIFRSPSNKGVKAIIRANFGTYEDFKSVFCAIDDHLGQLESFDMQNSDISRACFVSYDPNLYLNEEATLFEGYVDNWEEYLKNRRLASPEKTFDVLIKWMDKNGYTYQKGERNNYLYVLASAMCRYGVLEDRTKGFFIGRFTDISSHERDAVIESAYKRNDFGITKMTETRPEDDAAFYKGIDTPDFSFDPESVLVDNDDVNRGVFDIAHGNMKFESFGLKEMDRYLVLKTLELYGFVAASKAGKTLLISYLMLMAAKHSGWKFLVLTTEAEISDFKSTMVGFIADNHIKRCSDQQIASALEFIDQHFTFIENKLDHLQVFDVYHYLTTKGDSYQCIVVDPITNIKRAGKIKADSGNAYYEELYVEYLKFAKQYCSLWVIAHTVTSKERDGMAPHIPDAEYGVHLARRCHYGISLYRDAYDEATNNIVECHVKYVRTALNRGGGATLSNSPIQFHLVADKNHFGYDIVVDGKRFVNPLVNGRIPEPSEAPRAQNFYEKEPIELQSNDNSKPVDFDGFGTDNTNDETPF